MLPTASAFDHAGRALEAARHAVAAAEMTVESSRDRRRDCHLRRVLLIGGSRPVSAAPTPRRAPIDVDPEVEAMLRRRLAA